MIILDNYNSGAGAPYKSWTLLQKPAVAEIVDADDE
jgi:hypothetical protein